jgi:hypothetical protein
MRAVFCALLLCSALPAAAADSQSQAPYLDPCQCVRGTVIRGTAPKPADTLIQKRAPTNIYDPATTIRGEPPRPAEPGREDPYGAGNPLPPTDLNVQGKPPEPKDTEKPDRPLGMG